MHSCFRSVLIELQMVSLIDALLMEDGLDPPSSSHLVLPTSTVLSIPLASLGSAVDSAFVDITTAITICPICPTCPTTQSTVTLQRIRVY